ncbi:hypothetical protein D9M68_500880 [compost metagenome]
MEPFSACTFESPSRYDAPARVGSISSRICPRSTTSPSCTFISSRMPPSRLWMICSRLAGITRPSPCVISSTLAKCAHTPPTTRIVAMRYSTARLPGVFCTSIASRRSFTKGESSWRAWPLGPGRFAGSFATGAGTFAGKAAPGMGPAVVSFVFMASFPCIGCALTRAPVVRSVHCRPHRAGAPARRLSVRRETPCRRRPSRRCDRPGRAPTAGAWPRPGSGPA